MKKFLFAIGVVLCFSGVSKAQDIRATWEYTPPTSKTLSGFKLYKEGTSVCQTKIPTARSLDCDVSFTKEANDFTLTATFNDGTESQHSEKYTFNYIPSPKILKIEFK